MASAPLRERETITVNGYKLVIYLDTKKVGIFPPLGGNGISITEEVLENILLKLREYRKTDINY